ncbi:MAG: hypothetical protein U1D31_02440 [Patescibacteria group bacterium]|nr:hypothetical protein [bacterium]MDZ4240956.1 hypothetical protein [Patescibacteria group bacterium]
MGENIRKEKNAWDLASREFAHFSYFAGFVFLVFLILYLLKTEYGFVNIWEVLFSLVIVLFWYTLAQLFKKRDRKAVILSYIAILILFVWNLLDRVNIFAVLIFGYLLYRVYMADKSKAPLSAGMDTDTIN